MILSSPLVSPSNPKDYRTIFGPQAYQSDHLAIANAFLNWKREKKCFKDHPTELAFCTNNGLSLPALQRISQLRQQLIDSLDHLGLFASIASLNLFDDLFPDHEYEYIFNVNSNHPGIVKAVTLVGLYPQIAISHNRMIIGHSLHALKTLLTIHPSSINYTQSNRSKENNNVTLFAYQDKPKTTQPSLLGLTAISNIELILFSRLDLVHPELIAGWLRNECSFELMSFKSFLDRLLDWTFLACATNTLPLTKNVKHKGRYFDGPGDTVALQDTVETVRIALRLAMSVINKVPINKYILFVFNNFLALHDSIRAGVLTECYAIPQDYKMDQPPWQ